METLERVSWSTRVVNAMVAYFAYLKHLVWPKDLAIFYLRPPSWPLWLAFSSGGGLAPNHRCRFLVETAPNHTC